MQWCSLFFSLWLNLLAHFLAWRGIACHVVTPKWQKVRKRKTDPSTLSTTTTSTTKLDKKIDSLLDNFSLSFKMQLVFSKGLYYYFRMPFHFHVAQCIKIVACNACSKLFPLRLAWTRKSNAWQWQMEKFITRAEKGIKNPFFLVVLSIQFNSL